MGETREETPGKGFIGSRRENRGRAGRQRAAMWGANVGGSGAVGSFFVGRAGEFGRGGGGKPVHAVGSERGRRNRAGEAATWGGNGGMLVVGGGLGVGKRTYRWGPRVHLSAREGQR